MTEKFEQWLKDGAPEVPDSQLDEKVQRTVLKERIHNLKRSRSNNRRRAGIYVAVMALVLVVSTQVVDVGSDGFDVELVNTVDLPTAEGEDSELKIFKSKFTGNRVGSRTGSADELRNTMEVASGGVVAPHSISRCAFAGGWQWTITYYDEENDRWIGTSDVPDVEDKLNKEFTDFFINDSAKYFELVEKGKATKTGMIRKTIDNIDYDFTQWELLTPDSLVVEIWEGVPSQ